jgi:putative DNA primase/helicase
MLTAEDPIAEVVVPRLKAARAELTVVHFGALDLDGLSVPFRFPGDAENLAELVRKHRARLVVIDPLSAHLEGRIDSWKDQSVRQALAPLALLAEERDLAVVVVAHLNKGQSTDPLQRLGGSVGLPAAARSVLLLGRDPVDPEGERGNRRVLAHVKSNFGEQALSLAFAVEEAIVHEELVDYKTARIAERGTSPYRGSDLLESQSSAELPAALTEGITFLRQALADGSRNATEIEAEASQAGLSWETVKRAKKPAGVTTRKQRGVVNGPWIWELATDQSRTAEQPAA